MAIQAFESPVGINWSLRQSEQIQIDNYLNETITDVFKWKVNLYHMHIKVVICGKYKNLNKITIFNISP